MHTLVRFIGEEGRPDVLIQMGQELNQVIPEMFSGLDRGVPGRFSCSLSSADDWFDHRNTILDFVQRSGEVLMKAKALDVIVVFDVIVRADDYSDSTYTCFLVDKEVIAALASFDGEIEFSLCE